MIHLSKKENEEWAQAIGGLFLNFGLVEWISLRFIEMLRGMPVSNVAMRKVLAERIKTIKKLVEDSPWADAEKTSAIKLWKEVEDHIEMRNIVAHNPFVFGKNKDGKPGNGILNVKQLRGVGHYNPVLIQANDIFAVATAIGALAVSLNAFVKPREINAP
jgi:hypothetical protein